MDLNIFLDKIVFGWIKNDLERMTTAIPARSSEVGNINFPLALCVLSYMEYLGGFLLGKDRGFAENTGTYITQCFERPSEYPIEILRDIFRNGLAHEYFARGAISREGNRPAIYKEPMIGAILDVDTLVNDFLRSLEQFKTKITESNYQKRMDSAMKKIEQMKGSYSALIDGLPVRSYAGVSTTTSRASGASGYTGPIVGCMTTDPTIDSD